jgi:hypothetical protein
MAVAVKSVPVKGKKKAAPWFGGSLFLNFLKG